MSRVPLVVEPELRAAAPRPTGNGLRRRLVATLAVGLFFVACLAVVADELFQPDAFQIRHITVSGTLHHVDRQVLADSVRASLTGNFFSVNMNTVEAALEQLPWVATASVARRWPDTLQVEVHEQKPVARWGADRWLNDRQQIIDLPATPDLETLPRLAGPVGSEAEVYRRYQHWDPVLRAAGLRLRELDLSARRAWTVKVEEPAAPTTDAAAVTVPAPLIVTLGRDHPDRRLSLFALSYQSWMHGLGRAMAAVDMRYPNGLAISWRDADRRNLAAAGSTPN